MTLKKAQPVFVNLQSSAVRVFGPEKNPINVHPFRNKGTRPDAIYEVVGEHYRQFVSGHGPLYPFPGSDAALGHVAARTMPGFPTAAIMQADVNDCILNLRAQSVAEQAQTLTNLYHTNVALFNAVAIDRTRIEVGISGLPQRPVTKAPEAPTAPAAAAQVPTVTEPLPDAPTATKEAIEDEEAAFEDFNPFILKLIEDISPELEGDPAKRVPMGYYMQARFVGAKPVLPAEYIKYQSALDLLLVVETEHKVNAQNYEEVKEQLIAESTQEPSAINASGRAFKFAQEHDLDLNTIEGTGLNEQITIKDARLALAEINSQA